MTRRGRLRLLLVLVVVGLPGLVAAGVIYFVATGGLRAELQSAWRAHLPGELALDRVELSAGDTVRISGMRLRHDGREVASVDAFEAGGGLWNGRPEQMRLATPRLTFGPDDLEFLVELIDALRDLRQKEPPSWSLDMTGGALDFGAGAVHLRNVAGRLRSSDGRIAGHLEAEGATGLWRARFEPLAEGGSEVIIEQATLRRSELIALCRAFGWPPPDWLGVLLPEELSGAGTRLRLPRGGHPAGALRLQGGDAHLSGSIAGAQEGVTLADLRIAAPLVGRLSGALHLASDGSGELRWEALELADTLDWLPIPVPLRRLDAAMPNGVLAWQVDGPPEWSCSMHGAGDRRLALRMPQGRPWELSGRDLPLALVNDSLGRLRFRGGRIERLDARRIDGLWQGEARLQVATVAWQRIALMQLAARCSLRQRADGFQLDCELGSDVGSVRISQSDAAWNVVLASTRLASLRSHLRLPFVIPALAGSLEADLQVRRPVESPSEPVLLRRLRARALQLGPWLRGLELEMAGRLDWRRDCFSAVLDGGVDAGALQMSGRQIGLGGLRVGLRMDVRDQSAGPRLLLHEVELTRRSGLSDRTMAALDPDVLVALARRGLRVELGELILQSAPLLPWHLAMAGHAALAGCAAVAAQPSLVASTIAGAEPPGSFAPTRLHLSETSLRLRDWAAALPRAGDASPVEATEEGAGQSEEAAQTGQP